MAYDERVSEFIAIGDAAGMIDPFCGEGMRHALDTGRIAAAVIAEGLGRGLSSEAMRRRYEEEWRRRWRNKRRLGRLMRTLLEYPVATWGLGRGPERLLRQLWN